MLAEGIVQTPARTGLVTLEGQDAIALTFAGTGNGFDRLTALDLAFTESPGQALVVICQGGGAELGIIDPTHFIAGKSKAGARRGIKTQVKADDSPVIAVGENFEHTFR